MRHTLRLLICLAGVSLPGFLSACATMSKEVEQVATVHRYPATFEATRKRAVAGNLDAEYALGYMYYYGQGVPRDVEAARTWIHKAAVGGQIQAISAEKLLESIAAPHSGAIESMSPRPRFVHQSPPMSKKKDAKPVQTVIMAHNKAVPSKLTGDEKMLLVQSKHSYTLQLLGSFKQSDIAHFLNRNHLQGKAKTYETFNHGKRWYVAVLGDFPSAHSAKNAVHQLPKHLQDQHPWVKPMAMVQQGIQMKQPHA